MLSQTAMVGSEAMPDDEIPKGFAVEGSDFEQKLHEAGEPVFHAATLKERALAFYKDMGIDPPADLLAEWDDGPGCIGAMISNALAPLKQAPTPPPLPPPAPTLQPKAPIADATSTEEEEQ